VVEDVFTTGKSTREVVDMLRNMGARTVAAGSIVNRGLPAGALPVPSRSLLELEVPAWPESECPLCANGLPISTPGSRYQRAV
jgi:orotate phosphoribosyltransferase